MDQNKNDGVRPRQFSSQPVQRGSFAPTARTSFAPPTPAPVAPAPEDPQRVSFAPQQFSQPLPAPVAQPQNFKPLSFAPPTEEKKPKFGGRFKLPKLSLKQLIVSGGVALLIVVSGGVFQNLTADHSQEIGVKTKGRKVTVATPTITSSGLETSCYSFELPSDYIVTSTAGCSSVMSSKDTADASGISVNGTHSRQAFTMKSAPYQIREQLKLLGKVTEFKTAPAEVNDVKALKVLYEINDGAEQVMLYIPTPPATYVNNSIPTGGFMIRGGYDTASQQSNFDRLVQSLKWTR